MSHIINDRLNDDDDDIQREIKNLFVRTNMLISRFRKCSAIVKLTLFKSFCMSVYDVALWKYYSVTFLINLDQVTISASRNCLDTIELIVCLVF